MTTGDWLALPSTIGMSLFFLDDLFVDAIALSQNIGPELLDSNKLQNLRECPQKNVGIIVANWHEAEIIARMVQGNLQRIDYKKYFIFLGVYPNDLDTLHAAEELSQKYPQVISVINSRPGPTSKGQLLNEMLVRIIQMEQKWDFEFDLFLMQDSEDILHPLSLQLINYHAQNADFLQIPVFSFDLPFHQLVGSTYVDEFSETHTKDLLVRQRLGAPIPSAGVGTALSRKLVLSLLARQGVVFNENVQTEDYLLGLQARELGFRSRFICSYRLVDQKRDFVATREYFPKTIYSSVRQRGRWILGIALQCPRYLGKSIGWSDWYFRWRDRRGPVNGLILLASVFLLLWLILEPNEFSESLKMWMLLNMIGAAWRLAFKMRAVTLVHNPQAAAFSLIRWPLHCFLGIAAGVRALYLYSKKEFFGREIVWAKTQHELPQDFGKAISP